MKADDVKVIGVCGAGTMGAGIAQQAAVMGYTVRVLDVNDAAWDRGLGHHHQGPGPDAREGEDHGAMSGTTILGRLSYSTDAASLADADYIIEAVFEDYDVKKELFGRLEAVCRPEVVFATNTSSISITEIAAASGPARPGGGHALLQPGARAQAGGDHPRSPDVREDGRPRHGGGPAAWARRRSPARTHPGSWSTASWCRT